MPRKPDPKTAAEGFRCERCGQVKADVQRTPREGGPLLCNACWRDTSPGQDQPRGTR